MAAVQTGVALQRDTATDPAASPAARRDLAVSYSRLGDMLASTGATSEALEQHRLALGVMKGVSAMAPDDPANLRQLGVAHHKLGNVLGNPNYPNVGDHAGALTEMRQSVAVFERASALYPDNAMFRRNLAVARSNVADILIALGRREEAMIEERRALETYEAQVREDPSNAAAKNDLAIAFYKAAEMLDADGRTREALVVARTRGGAAGSVGGCRPREHAGASRDRDQLRHARPAAGQAGRAGGIAVESAARSRHQSGAEPGQSGQRGAPRGGRAGAHRTRGCGGGPQPPGRASAGRSRDR